MRIDTMGKLGLFLTQLILAVGVVTSGLFLELPWLVIAGVALLFVEACSVSLRRNGQMWSAALAWACTLAAWGGALLTADPVFHLDLFFAGMTSGIAVALLLAGWRLPEGRFRSHWRLIGMVWAFMTGAIWLGTAYVLNEPWQFYTGVGINVALLIAVKFLFRTSALMVQVVNTLIVLLAGFPVADALVRPSYRLDERPDLRKRLYAYEEARKNPAAFGHWWYYFVREWKETQKDICMQATNSPAPFRLRPGTEGRMFESRIRINQLGFRGPEIAAEKGDAYRIVTLGESTTFGHTMYADDVPWPRVLERMIRANLQPSRPVEVINAGIPSYTLHLNLERLRRKILALKPDMIISYHGYNGFNWLMPALPSVSGKAPPKYEARPLKLLADAEYRLKVMAYRRDHAPPRASTNAPPLAPMKTEYARGYRELIALARTNHIRLVLANYSMAVNADSDLDVIAFYRSGFPDVLAQIRANELHSQIVETLAKRHEEVTFVNTHSWLDGRHWEFIDLVHFTQAGRNKMAEAMFEGVKAILENDLDTSGG